MRFPEARILIFAKAPVPGAAKTRLIPTLGEAGAASLSAWLLERTLSRTAAADLTPVELWCAPHHQHPAFQTFETDAPLTLHSQHGDDLGGRMYQALTQSLEGCRYALLIGIDSPEMSGALLASALKWLAEGEDAVLGPVEDGGYWLIGVRRAAPQLFQGIQWGEAGVAAATRQRFANLGWSWRELPTLWDVDRPEELDRLYALKDGPDALDQMPWSGARNNGERR